MKQAKLEYNWEEKEKETCVYNICFWLLQSRPVGVTFCAQPLKQHLVFFFSSFFETSRGSAAQHPLKCFTHFRAAHRPSAQILCEKQKFGFYADFFKEKKEKNESCSERSGAQMVDELPGYRSMM